MKYPTVRVVFDRKKQATKQKAGLVQIEVLYNQKRKFISTGVKVYAGQWKEKTMVSGRGDAIELNDTILLMVGEVREYINSVIKEKKEFSFKKFEVFWTTRGGNESSFIDFMRGRIEAHVMKESTRKQHKVVLNKLIDFGKIQSFDDLTIENIKLFDEFTRTKAKKQSTVHGIHKRLKVYVKEAWLFGRIKSNPYDGMTIPRGDNSKNRKYLTFEELDRVRNECINDISISNVRDCFVFCCFTGLAYADLEKFNWKTDVIQEGEKYVIKSSRVKTGTNYSITLLSPAMDILRKHDFKLPVMTNQQYNLRLKVLASYAKINKNLTSHVARHTFATWTLSQGVNIEIVSKMLGHTDIKTTQIYAKILQEDVSRNFDFLERKLQCCK